MASAYLTKNQVGDAISELLQEREVIEATRQFPDLVKIYQYFHRTWRMTFPPKLWNVYDRPQRLRTTNFCELWNDSWSRKIQWNSPNFWTAVRLLKQQQRETENKIALARRGFRTPTQQKKWQNFNERVQVLKTSLVLGNRTLKIYWLNMSHFCLSI